MNLDSICKLEFRSSERRRSWYALGYKHFTPPGWEACHMDLAFHLKASKNLPKKQEVMAL